MDHAHDENFIDKGTGERKKKKHRSPAEIQQRNEGG